MNFIRVMEISIIIVLVVIFFTQVFLPVWRGRPMFPLFRGKHKALKELDAAREARDLKDAKKEAIKINR